MGHDNKTAIPNKQTNKIKLIFREGNKSAIVLYYIVFKKMYNFKTILIGN